MERRFESIPALAALLLALPAVAQAAEYPHRDVPGVVIHYSPSASGKYIGCPAIAILPGGEYVASHSFFGPKAGHRTSGTTLVFGSTDRGRTWSKRSEIDGQFWSTLFVHRGALYHMGTDKQWGGVVIRRSDDGGRTWTEPTGPTQGRLLDDGRYHSSTVPVVAHDGRLWRAMEAEDTWPERGRGTPHPYRALVLSAPLEANLLRADSWTRSNYLRFDLARVGKKPGEQSGGWREGNIVVAPGGQVVNFLRIDDAGVDRADLLPVSADGRRIAIDDENWGLIDFPGGRTKFTIRFDPASGRYWSLVNKQSAPEADRNVLALVSSANLKQWKVNTIVLRHRDRRHHAWQYVDWRFDGDDIAAVSRTAWDDSHNFHDANYLTFHRIDRFRERTMDDAAPWLP
ncbi:MAG: sialidase family protein [Thermoguttaceae bacterium]